jgi:iron complex outermembrane receptor protein
MRNLILWLIVLLAFGTSQAQTGKTFFTGKVTDKNGLPIAFATIQITESNAGSVSGEQGIYLIKTEPGTWTIRVTAIGFEEQTKQLGIAADETKTVDFQLENTTYQLNEVTLAGVKARSASATRTLMEIQDIPQSIIVIGQQTIRQQAAIDLTTLTRNMTGLNFTGNYSGAGSYQFFNARGFDLVNSQNFRWNGLMIWNLGNQYGDNLEQVEFLKGPTSITFGDVAPGGVLNFVTKKPLAEFYANVNFKTGEWGLIRPSVDISGPLNESKTLRYRLNATYEQSNSFRDFVKSSRVLVAPTLAWDISPKLLWSVEGVYRSSTTTDDAGLVSPDGTVAGLSQLPPNRYLGETDHEYLYHDQNLLSTLTYLVNSKWRVRNVVYGGYTTNRPWGLWPGTPDENGNVERGEYGYHQWLRNFAGSLDLAGTFYTGSIKHNLLVGLDGQSTRFRYTNEGYLSPYDTFNIFQPVYGQTVGVAPTKDSYLPFVSVIDRAGVYFQDQLMFWNEKLHLLVGFRAGLTRQGNDYLEEELPGSDYEGYADDAVTVRVFTPRAGLVFKPKTWMSVYASFAQGYEVNPPDIFAQNYADFSNPPATLSNQLEAGIKTSLMQDRLGVSFTVFQLVKNDPYGFVYLDPDNPNFDEYNVYYEGKHRSQGVELDVNGDLTDWLSLTAGTSFTDARILEDPGYPEGNLLANAPRYTGNIWLNYEPKKGNLKGFTAGAGYYYKSKFFTSLDNDPSLEVPDQFTLDLAVGYTFKSVSLQLNVTNLTNEVNYLNPWVFNLFDVQPLRRGVLTLNYQIR